MKLQLPKILTKRPAFLTRKPAQPKPPKKLNAATASSRMRPGLEDDYDDEPQTRLSSAFFVVLILHVVAVGGIYAFNSIKAHRRGLEPAVASAKASEDRPASEPAAAPPKPHSAPIAEPPARTATAAAALAPAAAAPATNARTYHVKAGDTLMKIAASLGVSVAELQFVNSPKELATLHPGQAIVVPARKSADRTATPEAQASPASTAAKKPADTATRPATTSGSYEVQKGDTATSIAKRFGVSVDELLKLNKIADPTKLQLGQKLKVPPKKS